MKQHKLDSKMLNLENTLLRRENMELKALCRKYQDAIELVLSKTEMTQLLKHEDVHETMRQFLGKHSASNAVQEFSEAVYARDMLLQYMVDLSNDETLDAEVAKNIKKYLKKFDS